MRVFICKLCKLLILLFSLLLIFWGVIIHNRAEICKIDANILFLGNSRVQYGIDDRLIPRAFNAGLNADNYVFSYLKLKLLKKYNPQIDTLYLGYDAPSVYNYFEKTTNDKFHPYFWDILDKDDWLFFIENDSDIFTSPLHWLKILYPLRSYISEVSFQNLGLGGFSELYRDKLREDIELMKGNKKNGVKVQPNLLQKKYLDKIVSFCHRENIELYFINMPSYTKDTNEDLWNNKLLNYENIRYYDFECIELPDSCYGDITHLNYRGAKVFTSFMINKLGL